MCTVSEKVLSSILSSTTILSFCFLNWSFFGDLLMTSNEFGSSKVFTVTHYIVRASEHNRSGNVVKNDSTIFGYFLCTRRLHVTIDIALILRVCLRYDMFR